MGSLMRTCLLLLGAVMGTHSAGVPSGDNKIVGGRAINITSAPYQLSMEKKGVFFCGASIISDVWALTAAHCCNHPKEDLTVRAGSSYPTSGGTIHNISLVIPHENYKFINKTHDYDIGLLKVATPFNYTISIQRIALPAPKKTLTVGTMCVISGWGYLAASGPASNELMAVQLLISSQESCAAVYLERTKRSKIPTKITSRMVCAHDPAGVKSPCNGDSGGPMAAVLNKQKMLVGVVSFAWPTCNDTKMPAVFASVPNLRNWIESKSGV